MQLEHGDCTNANDEGQDNNEVEFDLEDKSYYLKISSSNEEWMSYQPMCLTCREFLWHGANKHASNSICIWLLKLHVKPCAMHVFLSHLLIECSCLIE